MPRLSRPDDVSVWGPEREWWVFNPGPRLDICLAEGIYDFVYHQKTYAFKTNMRISPQRHLTQLGQNYPWRVMLLDYHEDVALLYEHETGWGQPTGVFPMWSAKNHPETLIKLLQQYPEPGDQVGWFTGADRASTAVEGQERRVVICNMPRDGWEPVFRDLMDVKRAYPDFVFHLNGQKSIPRTLGTGVDSFDHPVTLEWLGDQPVLLKGNGDYIRPDWPDKKDATKWGQLVGMRPRDIFNEDNRTIKSRRMYLFNLRSLKWAFANYDTVWSMKVVDESEVDKNDPDSSWIPVDVQYRPRAQTATDKWICDLCSISHRCPFYRPGAICAVDDTEAAELTKNFKSRNARDIIDGLGILVGAQVARAKRSIDAEDAYNREHPDEPRFLPETRKVLEGIFTQGVNLARLIDPSLNGSGTPGGARGRNGKVIDVGLAGQIARESPQQLASDFARELEAMGIDISKLTPEEAEAVLARIVPSASLPAHVDDDGADTADQNPGTGSAVAPSAPPFRASPGINP